jgi:uncharacterized protein
MCPENPSVRFGTFRDLEISVPSASSVTSVFGSRVSLAEYRPMRILLTTTILLICSNVFMTFAWYAHLKNLSARPWYIAVIVSWAIAFFEYALQVPANRIGFTRLSLAQLKVLQEVITLLVFVPFAVAYMKQPIKLDYVWAGLCLLGAVYFVFRS